MSKNYEIGRESLILSDIADILSENLKLRLSEESKRRILDCREYLDKKIKETKDPVYGINTGFGSLCNHRISNKEMNKLQSNLVMSHACGTGDEVPIDVVKIMLLLKIQSLSYGHSGVHLATVERLIDMFNSDILPVVYQQGSLGASGDLAPLAHMTLSLIGKGQVYSNDISEDKSFTKMEAADALRERGWEPLELKSKEGLALLNGTQLMGAYGVWAVLKSQRLSYMADLISAVSLEAFDGRSDTFEDLLHQVRPHEGQVLTAENFREILEGSEIQKQHKEHVQDPYSFRCIPQVHGATKDVISHVKKVFTTEINSVTDNPTIFADNDRIISGGNFHGQPLAMSMDYLCIAISELGNISERRIYQLMSGTRGLPEFLIADPGLNSGMMISQYTAASIVNQNKQLCTPVSVDSITSSNGQEDHVSMGANAATKLYKIVENVEVILSIELMNAAQAISFRNNTSSDFIESFIDSYRQDVKFLDEDRLMHQDMQISIDFLRSLDIDNELL